MEVRQKALIELRSSIPDFIACLERHMPDAWERSPKAEKSILGSDIKPQCCFTLKSSDSVPAPAQVWLDALSDNLLRIVDVLPHKGQLTREQCNQIQKLFIEQVATPAANECGASITFEPSSVGLEDLLQPSTVETFRTFLATADKKTGLAGPDEEDAWQDFLIEMHLTGWQMTTFQLGRWLAEEEDWPNESIERLMLEYEFAHELLRAYDERSGKNSADA
jgi:hypothetical protein